MPEHQGGRYDWSDSLPVLLLGSDTRLGDAIRREIVYRSGGMEPTSKTNEELWQQATPATYIHQLVDNRQPRVIINAMVDPWFGPLPSVPEKQLLLPTHAAVQQAINIGAVYVHCSSSQVYGQAVGPAGRDGYHPYDPAIACSLNPWSQLLLAVERSVCQYMHAGCPAFSEGVPDSYRHYLLRFGMLIGQHDYWMPPSTEAALSAAASMIANSRELTVVLPNPAMRVSPVSLRHAAESVVLVASQHARVRAGIYNIGSADAVEAEQLLKELAQRHETKLKIVSEMPTGGTLALKIREQRSHALNVLYWQRAIDRGMPSWREAVAAS